ncbi:glycerophosphodiester phosphodiesterase family protein [Yoonia sp. MH D7]
MTLDPAFLNRPITHRALHDVSAGRAENSIKAIQAAIDAGYGIEIDLQLSADGVPMVFHDYDLGRLTDQAGPLAMRSAQDLCALSLRHDGDGIPTLAQVLALVAGRVPLLIELKDQDGQLGENIGSLGAATAAALAGYTGPLALMSFNPHAVAEMRDLLPNVPRGLTTGAFRPKNWPTIPLDVLDRLRDIPDFTRVGACFVSHRSTHLTMPRITELKSQGIPVLCWTVKSPEAEIEARVIADNITFEGYLA